MLLTDSLASRESPPRRAEERPCTREVFPVAHPYGTGSFASEQGTYVPPQRVCRNRLLSLQSFFRRSSRYCFWQLDMNVSGTYYYGIGTGFARILNREHLPKTNSPRCLGASYPARFQKAAPGGRSCLRLLVFLMCLIARRVPGAETRFGAICNDAESSERPCASPSMLRAPHMRVL